MKNILPLKPLSAFTLVFVILILIIMIHQSIQNTEYTRENDPYDYAKVGESIWSGNGIALNGKPYVLLPPGFSVIVGGFNVVFQNPELSVKLASMLFWLFSVILVYHFFRFFFEEQKYQFIGVLLYSSNLIMIQAAAAGRVEPVFLSFLLLFMILSLKKSENNIVHNLSYAYVALLAVVASVMYYLRPEGLWIGGVLWLIVMMRLPEPVFKKIMKTLFFSFVVMIIIFPYTLFLKNHTGYWQLSGKTYANLVMGEMESPYQTGKYDENETPNRYKIINRIINNPLEARPIHEYFSESADKLYERIWPNVRSLATSLWHSYSIIGILLIVFGLAEIPFSRQMWIWGTISVIGLYLLFFILNRIIAMYQPFFIIMLTGGMVIVTDWIKKTFFENWAESVIYVLTGLFMVFHLRHIEF